MKLSRVNVSVASLQMEREGKIDSSYVIGIEEVEIGRASCRERV